MLEICKVANGGAGSGSLGWGGTEKRGGRGGLVASWQTVQGGSDRKVRMGGREPCDEVGGRPWMMRRGVQRSRCMPMCKARRRRRTEYAVCSMQSCNGSSGGGGG